MRLKQPQAQAQLLRLIMDIFSNEHIISKASEEFFLGDIILRKVPLIDHFEDFVYLANKYRNLFRNNFQDNSLIPYKESLSFFLNLELDSSRVLYAISMKDEWIGHFGFRILDNSSVLLDNALRFSNNGGKDLFQKINLLFIDFIFKSDPDIKIAIILERKNTNALNLHKNINFRELSDVEHQKLGVDYKKFSLQNLSKLDYES